MSSPRSRPSITAFRSSSPLGWAGVSALLHAAVLAAILLRLGVNMPAEPPPVPSIELRLVETQGAGPAAPAPPAPATPPAPPPQPAPASASVAQEPAPEALPLPPPAPPSPQVPTPTARPMPPTRKAAPPSPPEVNLGGGDSLTNALASGPAVLPARPDQHWRNREPVYPVAAAERGEHGAVVLLIHVDPDGAVTGVEIAETSGFLLLDRAAREAVQTWHFLPAVRDGKPVPSAMPLRVLFQLN